MKSFFVIFLFLASCAVRAQEVPNFLLLDYRGKAHELHRAEGKAVVLFFPATVVPLRAKASPNCATFAASLPNRASRFG